MAGMTRVRLGLLRRDTVFRTLITNRDGIVLELPRREGREGVQVMLTDLGVRSIHPDVIVGVELWKD